MLIQAAIFLLAAVLLVPLCSRLALGAVLGYLIAGVLIGPSELGLVTDVDGIMHVSEFGVVLLLFVIGLELQPARLWVLRHQVFGLGAAQVLLTGAALAGLALWFGLSWQAALVTGLGLAMSSTAFVLQSLAEKGQLTTRHGREAFAILLFQDLAVIPLLALMPLLAGAGEEALPGWQSALRAVLIIAATIVASRTLLRPVFRSVIRFGGREIFTAMALLVVIGMALLMESLGLSMSLGAFLAGVLLADSEYRHELEAAIGPFKGLFLGLFFMAVGMSTNVGLLMSEPGTVLGLVFGLIAVKALALYCLRRIRGVPASSSRKLALVLAQGGEFAFVLFAMAQSQSIFNKAQADLLTVVVTVSMLVSPLLLLLEDKLLSRWLDREPPPEYDAIDAPATPVVIAGYGRFGQVVSRILNSRQIPFTALDSDPETVDVVRRFGNKVYYGDSAHLDLLYAAKVGEAKLFVLAVEDVEKSLKTAEMVRRHFPNLPIYARARNRFHAYKLMDLGVRQVVRETLYSSMELSRGVLAELGLSAAEVERTVAGFRAFDNKLLLQQHAIYQDEEQLIQTSKQVSDELKDLFEAQNPQMSAEDSETVSAPSA